MKSLNRMMDKAAKIVDKAVDAVTPVLTDFTEIMDDVVEAVAPYIDKVDDAITPLVTQMENRMVEVIDETGWVPSSNSNANAYSNSAYHRDYSNSEYHREERGRSSSSTAGSPRDASRQKDVIVGRTPLGVDDETDIESLDPRSTRSEQAAEYDSIHASEPRYTADFPCDDFCNYDCWNEDDTEENALPGNCPPRGETKRQKRRNMRMSKREKSKMNKSEEHRAQKCYQQIASLGLPGTMEEILTALREHFRVEYMYSSLPVDGPVDYEAVEVILDRPPKYQEKYVQQEASLLQKLYQMGVGPGDCVVDLGCGNGTLAFLTSFVFGSSAIGVDMETPREELCAESYVPPSCANRFMRIERNIQDPMLVDETLAVMDEMGVTRLAVVCKHLCGTGSDLCLKYIEALQKSGRIEVIGCVVATCCYHKIVNDMPTYEECHDVSSPYLDQICRWTMWKSTALSDSNNMSAAHVDCAIAFEDMIQAPRIRMLRRLFPHVKEVVFISHDVSPHNRALVASAAPLRTDGSWALKGVNAALAELQERWNLWPRGITSKRFEIDADVPEEPAVSPRTEARLELEQRVLQQL